MHSCVWYEGHTQCTRVCGVRDALSALVQSNHNMVQLNSGQGIP